MGLEKFVGLLEQEFSDGLPLTIDPDKDFKEMLPWDSMNTAMLMSLIKIEYNVDLKIEHMKSFSTVRELYTMFIEPAVLK